MRSEPLRVFIGYDAKEPVAFAVLAHSILARASGPVSITPLVQGALRSAGLYTRERGPTESTEFSLTRFLVPHLSGYRGHSVFLDCDILCQTDLCEMWDEIDRAIWDRPLHSPRKAVLVCPHDYAPTEGTKFLGQPQTTYPRKNWSSVMVFDNVRCGALTPAYVNTATGLELHRFQWLTDAEIGFLPLGWNWLVGEYTPNPEAKLLHYTLGGPWFPETADCDHAEAWRAEREAMLGLPVGVA